MEIRGRSISENSTDFYKPLAAWVDSYVDQTEVRTRVIFSFDFINTASTKWIYSIVKRLALYPNVREIISIEWYYEKGDEDQYELGQIIHSFIDCPFIFYETEQT